MNDDVVQEILNAIKDNMRELKEGQKEIQKDIGEIKITQAEQHLTLVDHTKRSTTNEEEIKLARAEFKKEIEPLKRDAWKFKGAIALIGFAFIIVSILSLLHKI